MKDTFVTNMFLFKIGKNLELNKFMRTKDPDPKTWNPPFTTRAASSETLNCTGKNITDGVESMLAAMFMSTDLFTTLQFISDIQLVPLRQARLLEMFRDRQFLLPLPDSLDIFGFTLQDNVSTLYKKYIDVCKVPHSEISHLLESMRLDEKPARFGSKFQALKASTDLKMKDTASLRQLLLDTLCPGVEKILNYSFGDKNVLLQALTHESF